MLPGLDTDFLARGKREALDCRIAKDFVKHKDRVDRFPPRGSGFMSVTCQGCRTSVNEQTHRSTNAARPTGQCNCASCFPEPPPSGTATTHARTTRT